MDKTIEEDLDGGYNALFSGRVDNRIRRSSVKLPTRGLVNRPTIMKKGKQDQLEEIIEDFDLEKNSSRVSSMAQSKDTGFERQMFNSIDQAPSSKAKRGTDYTNKILDFIVLPTTDPSNLIFDLEQRRR